MVLQSLVKSADKNLDEAMDWKEFEGFGDFDLVFRRWPQMWRILQEDLLAALNMCGGGEGKCFPLPWTTEDLKRCQAFPTLTMCVQVFLRAKGDRPTRPELCLPRRFPVPWMDPRRLARSQNN